MDSLSESELATRSGTTVDRIRRLVELGLLAPKADGTFLTGAINRVRLADALDREGVSLEDMGRAIEGGQLSFDFMDGLFFEPAPLREQTVDEWASLLGVTIDDLRRLYASWALPVPVSGQRVRGDDALALEALRALPNSELRTDVLMSATRYFGDNVRRIAESQVQFFKATFIEPLVRSGMPLNQVMDSVAPIAAALRPTAQTLLAWLHARHFESEVFQEVVLTVEQIMAAGGYTRRRPVSPPAIAFVDLSGYTRLTEESGDHAASMLAEGLAQLVNEAAASYRGRVVKLLGDGVMFYFADPADAVRCGLAVVGRATELGLPRARMGVNAGDVLFRDGDYYGRTVNIAARIVEYARPGEVLASEDAVAAAASDGVAFSEIGPVLLRGLDEPIRVYRASSQPSE